MSIETKKPSRYDRLYDKMVQIWREEQEEKLNEMFEEHGITVEDIYNTFLLENMAHWKKMKTWSFPQAVEQFRMAKATIAMRVDALMESVLDEIESGRDE